MIHGIDRVRFARQVGWISALILLLTLSFAYAGKNPPPPVPMLLSLADGINVATAQGTKLELYKQSSEVPDSFQKDLWTESAYGGAPVLFADLDGYNKPAIVVARSCSVGKGRTVTYGHFINVFKDGSKGLSDTTYYDTSKWVMSPVPQGMLAAGNLDNEPGDEIILLAPPTLAIIGYSSGVLVQKASIDLQAELGMSLTYRSMDIGDADHGGHNEIVLAASFRATQKGDDQEYLIMLRFDPANQTISIARALDLYDDPGASVKIGSFCISDLRLADWDGDGQKEIWAAGWQNHWELVPPQYDQKVFGWKLEDDKLENVAFLGVEGSGGTAEGYSLLLGPHMAVGDYLGDGADQIIIQRHDPKSSDAFPHRIEVYSRFTDGTPILRATYQYSDRHVTQIVVKDERLFVIGFIPATTGMRYFFDILAPGGSDPFSRLFSVSGAGELDGLAVAKGIQQQMP